MRALTLTFLPLSAWIGISFSAMAKTACFDQTLCVDKRQERNRIHFKVTNLKPQMTITGKFTFLLTNMEVVDGTASPFVLKGGETRDLFTLLGSEDGRWQYHQSVFWARGNHFDLPDEEVIYHLPFAIEQSYAVLQGCNSEFTHRDHDANSIDFDMPVGSEVHAARGGLIVDLKEDSQTGGNSPSLRLSGNKIIIEHDDGTMAQYGHLHYKGAVPALGDRVVIGQLIGYSGNTGYSSHPHLHFGVTAATKSGLAKSLPITFQTSEGAVVCPPKGTLLSHP